MAKKPTNNDGDDGNAKPGAGEPTPTVRSCGTMNVHRRLLNESPPYAAARQRIEEQAFLARHMMVAQRTGCTKIPVVVHVVYKTAAQNISQKQIESQIRVLNEDFRKQNADVGTTPAPFAPFCADARMMFELATVDPAGAPSTGITRTATTVAAFSDDDKVKAGATGGHDPWPRSQYLNIWVCQLGGGLLGYAQFPGGPPETDGVVIRNTAFGTTGTAAPPFNLGRTATHEIGHYFNLRHIWGDDGDGCGGDDFVADTPNQGGPHTGTPPFPSVSCANGPNGDMFMNFMDYVDDSAMVMFTAGQVVRMQAALDGPRSTVGASVPCGPTAKPLPKESPKDLTKEIPKDPPKDIPKDGHKDIPKDPPKDIPKDGHKDVPKDPPKDIPKDGHKDVPKDPPKDVPKDGHKDFPKDPPKDVPKDGHKDFPKDLPKDGHKDFPKDPPKDAPKDGHKDFPKDPPKDFGKDPPKDGHKDVPKDGSKDILKDPPKEFAKEGFSDQTKPPMLEQLKLAIEFTSPGDPLEQPDWGSFGAGGGGGLTPFVLGGGGGRQSDPARDQVMAACGQLLNALAQLAAAGMLDANGRAMMQQLWATYQQLAGGQS